MSPLTLHIHRRFGRGIEVTTEDKNNVLYRATKSRLGSETTITRAATNASPEMTIGGVRFNRTDFTVHSGSAQINMRKSGLQSARYDVMAPGINWKWERHGRHQLIDDKRQMLAEYDGVIFFGSMGKLTVFAAVPPHILDLIVLTCLVKIEDQNQRGETQTFPNS